MVRTLFAEKSGRNVTMKDIHNLARGLKYRPENMSVELEELVSFLNSHNLLVDFIVDDDSTLIGIFVQDEQMKEMFNQFPEVLLADATHKTNRQRMPFYMMTELDDNGCTEVTAALRYLH